MTRLRVVETFNDVDDLVVVCEELGERARFGAHFEAVGTGERYLLDYYARRDESSFEAVFVPLHCAAAPRVGARLRSRASPKG